MKALILATLLALPLPALATTECKGEHNDGHIITVRIDTVGTMGAVKGGEVVIELKDGTVRKYSVRGNEIPQFFEATSDNMETATVGLSAFVDGNFPVSIRYAGPNFEGNLKKHLLDPSRKKVAGNLMRVWKGSGFNASEQFVFRDVICSVSLDP